MNIAEKLEQLFSTSFERGLFSGNVLVAKDGKALYTGIFGLSDYDNGAPLTNNSLFELASVTKPFTAIGIAILVELGKLNYHDAIEKWLPNFPYPHVTLQHALTHTSGLPDYMELFEKHWDHQRIATNADVLHLLATYRPAPYFHAGEKYQYSNTGYVCLASVIEAAARLPYAMFIQNYVFDRAQMQRTKIMNRRYKPESIEDFAYGFIRSAEDTPLVLPDGLAGYEFVKYLDGIQGDGMVHSTMMDLLAFDTALRSGKLINASSLQLALSPILTEDGQKTPCGYGWFIDYIANIGRRIFHSGGWPGYSAIFASYVEAGYTIILLSNVESLYREESMSSWLQQIEQYLFKKTN